MEEWLEQIILLGGGGITHDGYCFLWRDSEFKELIRNRDNHTCVCCGATEDLVIHHIDYNKLNCKEDNLATVCRSCNGKANFGRRDWKVYYKQLLKNLYLGMAMTANTTRSKKAKGQRLQKWMCSKISNLLNIPWGKDELISTRESGLSGTDVRLVGEAQKQFPFSVEAKYQETWSVPSYIRQAKENQKEGTNWLLVIKKNRQEPIVVLDAKVFFGLLSKANSTPQLTRKEPKLILKKKLTLKRKEPQ